MTGIEPTAPKLLFVVSNDFGELGYALHFLRQGPFRPVVLLPERLHSLQGAALGVRALPYRSPADILAADATEVPAVVVLCSGYLFALNGLFSEAAVEELLRKFSERGRRLVTTDPFLGLWSTDAATLVAERHPLKALLTGHFSRLARMLGNVVHLYAVRPPESIQVPWMAFSNPHMVLGPPAWHAVRQTLARVPGVDPERQRWLFLLSQEDYGAQSALHGRGRFDALLADKVRATSRAGRQGVVIGPPDCILSLNAIGLAAPEALLVSSCGYDLFNAFLLDAEYAFYWNVFSHSVPQRGVNRLPIFFFDQGHLGRALPNFLPVGLRCYYGAAELPFLDPLQTAEPEELATMAARQAHSLAPAREAYTCSPSPAVVISRLMGSQQ